jgi:poly-beta-1,6-N-acetyl-D-glucosamine synthase
MKSATITTSIDESRSDVIPADHNALPCYIVVTPARNEAAFIKKTIESMIRQTVLPLKWMIVDDGSTDETAEIVSQYLPDYPWINLVRSEKRKERNFAGKVNAFNAGLERTQDIPWEFVCNLDGDISFDPDHFEFLLGRCVSDPQLGVVGTTFREEGFDLARDVVDWESHVGGQCQMFRRECFEEIGGYVPVATGGIDWVAVITARMKGWKTRSFAEREFYHFRPMGTAGGGSLTSAYRYGRKDYCIGSHPLWELARVARRLWRRPYLLSGIVLAAGYGWAWINRTPRGVSKELIQFHRREQMTKLKKILRKHLLG